MLKESPELTVEDFYGYVYTNKIGADNFTVIDCTRIGGTKKVYKTDAGMKIGVIPDFKLTLKSCRTGTTHKCLSCKLLTCIEHGSIIPVKESK